MTHDIVIRGAKAVLEDGTRLADITIDGERLDVDCYAMRDRSWGRRVPTPGLHIGYDLCADEHSAFVVFSQPDSPGTPIGTSFLWASSR